MKEILTITNRKGGTGKTFTAFTIGAGLTQRGYKVLLVDLDSQASLTFDTGANPNGATSYEVLTGSADIRDAIQTTPYGDILPGSPKLATADIVITNTGKEYRLKEALEPIRKNYDYCIIDTAPQLGILTVNALTGSTGVLIPAQAEIGSLKGIDLLRDVIGDVRKYTNPKLKIKGILLTRYNGRAILSQDMRYNLEEKAKELHTKLYSTAIRETVAVREAEASQMDIFTYAKRSNATTDYNAFIDELLKDLKGA